MTHINRLALIAEFLSFHNGDEGKAIQRIAALAGIDIKTAQRIIKEPTSGGTAPIYFNLVRLCIRNDLLLEKNRHLSHIVKRMRALLDACSIEYNAPTIDEFRKSIKEGIK